MNKKGYIQDFAFFGIFMLAFVIFIFIGSKVFGEYNEKYQEINTSSDGIGQQMMARTMARYGTLFDWVYLTVFVLFALGMLVSFFLIDAHPTFFFLVIIIFAMLLVALAVLQNVFEKFEANPSMATESPSFPMINFVMDHWVLFMVVFGFIGITLLFAKMQYEGFR